MMKATNNGIPKNPKTLPERIRFMRGERSQEAFADRLNDTRVRKAVPASSIRQAMISRYEQGNEMPSPWVLYRMARAGHTTIEWILTGVK
jgi:transcriptional regulator with XRE-family HTH domain